ncbi:MAG: hypothetical protein VST72_08745 [Nitrospirota bacterium]|nr:hypothetical protein [Nitrospirota bacterium]
MKKFIRKFEDAMTAVTFAEAGEFGTAREIMREGAPLDEEIKSLKHEVDTTIDDLTSVAITFAEAGEHEKAVEILKEIETRLDEIRENVRRESHTHVHAMS